MNPQFDHKFLEQYLAGKMSPVEKMAFEARLAGDNVLRAELEAMKRMQSSSSEVQRPEIAATSYPVDEIDENSRTYWPYLVIAFLSFVALVYIALFRL